MFRKNGLILALALACGVKAQEGVDWKASMTKLKEQLLAVEVGNGRASSGIVKKMIEAQREDGSWPYVDYTDKNRSGWATARHVNELYYLAKAWRQSHNAQTEKAFHLGLKYWLDAKLTNPNWWWNQIGVPQTLALSCLAAEDCLGADERAEVCKALEVTQIGATGQNRVWLSRIVMMRGMLAGDAELVKKAVDAISGELKMSDSEGIREDWCFHQHGRQPQMGNYGLSFIDSMTRFAQILKGTPFEFPKEKMELLHHLLADGYAWILWNGYMDVSCMGRQLVQSGQKRKGDSVVSSINRFRRVGYDIPQDGPWGFKYFHKSAYAVYRNRENMWMASVRMSTPDIIGVETWINGDSPNGGHMADGALFVYSTGREYEDIFPLWNNWRLIPGITSYLNLPPYKKPEYHFERGANEADEIVTRNLEDGRKELSFLLKREGLTARKSWVFSPDGIVATGKDISSTNEKGEVVTCVEQAMAQKNAQIFPYENGCLRAVNGDFEYRIMAPAESIVAAIEERSGKPRSVMPTGADRIINGKVFSLYIRHGVKPKGAEYHYEIVKRKDR